MKMNGRYLLDSNVIIDVFRGNQKTIKEVQKYETILISVISIGELYFGANKSKQTENFNFWGSGKVSSYPHGKIKKNNHNHSPSPICSFSLGTIF